MQLKTPKHWMDMIFSEMLYKFMFYSLLLLLLVVVVVVVVVVVF